MKILDDPYSVASICTKLYPYAIAVKNLPFIADDKKLKTVTNVTVELLKQARKESLKVNKKASVSEDRLNTYIEKFKSQKTLDDSIKFMTNIIKKAQDADAKKGN